MLSKVASRERAVHVSPHREKESDSGRSHTCIMLYRTRPMLSFSATAKYCSMVGLPTYAAYESLWMFTAHSNRLVSACPVPTYRDWRCSSWLLMLNLSAALAIAPVVSSLAPHPRV